MRIWPMVLAAALAVGCLQSESLSAAPPQRDAGSLSPIACPPGLTWNPSPDVCAGVIGGSWVDLGEPSLAIDPTDARHMVIAAVANIGESQPSDPAPRPVVGDLLGDPPARTPCSGFNVCAFFTVDGGTSWANVRVPAPDGWTATFDPQVVFDSMGRLHLVTMVTQKGGSRLEHLTTDDDGRTWSAPALLDFVPHADRPWLRAASDQLLLTWLAGSDSGWATTRDGVTWSHGIVENCRITSPPAPTAGGLVFFCFGDGQTQVVRVAAGAATKISTFEAPRWFEAPVRLKDGRIVAVASHTEDDEATLALRWSGDDGATWSPAIDVRKAVPHLQALPFSCLMAANVDAGGRLHLIVAGVAEHREIAQLCLPSDANRTILHIVVDASDGAVVGAPIFGAPDRAPSPRPARPTFAVNDDFHDIVTVDGHTWAAWSHMGVVLYARLA